MLCLAMLLASEDNLLHMYLVVLPAMALILRNFVVTQRFLEMTTTSPCSSADSPPPPEQPTAMWSQLIDVVRYFVGREDDGGGAAAADAHVDDAPCDSSSYYAEMFFALLVPLQLAVTGLLVGFIAVAGNCSKVERIALAFFVNMFLVPCCLKIAGSPASDVDAANRLVCHAVCCGTEVWSLLRLERMLFGLFEDGGGVGLGWQLVELWFRARRPLLVSWLVAYSAQLVDSLLEGSGTNVSSEVTFAQVIIKSVMAIAPS